MDRVYIIIKLGKIKPCFLKYLRNLDNKHNIEAEYPKNHNVNESLGYVPGRFKAISHKEGKVGRFNTPKTIRG